MIVAISANCNTDFYFVIANDCVFSNEMVKSNHNEQDIYLMSEYYGLLNTAVNLLVFFLSHVCKCFCKVCLVVFDR